MSSCDVLRTLIISLCLSSIQKKESDLSFIPPSPSSPSFQKKQLVVKGQWSWIHFDRDWRYLEYEDQQDDSPSRDRYYVISAQIHFRSNAVPKTARSHQRESAQICSDVEAKCGGRIDAFHIDNGDRDVENCWTEAADRFGGLGSSTVSRNGSKKSKENNRCRLKGHGNEEASRIESVWME